MPCTESPKKLHYANGIFKIEWKVDWTEYSYEINASTGEVVSYEMDYDD